MNWSWLLPLYCREKDAHQLSAEEFSLLESTEQNTREFQPGSFSIILLKDKHDKKE